MMRVAHDEMKGAVSTSPVPPPAGALPIRISQLNEPPLRRSLLAKQRRLSNQLRLANQRISAMHAAIEEEAALSLKEPAELVQSVVAGRERLLPKDTDQ